MMTNCEQKLTPGMESQTPGFRDERIDSVKFWLVFLVIVTHLTMRKEFADSVACAVLWNWMNVFIMPLFIFISGYFSRKKDKKDFWPGIWKLLEPLVVFQVVALLFYGKPLTIKSILTPWYLLWYLLSLVCWRLLLQVVPDKILSHAKLILAGMFCVSLLIGFVPFFGRALSLQRTFSMMPFFFLGYFMKGRNLYLPDKYKPLCMLFLAGILAIALLFFHHRINDLYYATPYQSIHGAAIRLISFALAVPMSIAFVNVFCKPKWAARQGKMTLQYYIFHALVIPNHTSPTIPPLIVLAGKLNLPMSLGTAAAIAIAVTLGISLALKIPGVRMLTNPSSFFVKS